jgi:hypothetical protein
MDECTGWSEVAARIPGRLYMGGGDTCDHLLVCVAVLSVRFFLACYLYERLYKTWIFTAL